MYNARVKKRVALVLAGGAARGAYEVGVVEYVLHDVARALKRPLKFDILCGTSVGALNACGLAAYSHLGKDGVTQMREVWHGLNLDELVRTDVRSVLSMGSRLLGRGSATPPREGGLLDPSGLEELVGKSIPFDQIDENLDQGHVDALSVSTTHVQSGKTVVFVQRRERGLPPWSADPTIEPRAASIRVHHALASAAIPILFRSVLIDGEFHCDGGLRQNVPLSPARRLGADAVLVINPRYVPTTPLAEGNVDAEADLPGPLFLLGKTLNALLLDRIDTDLARLESVNRILEAGTKAYGPGFVEKLNQAMGHKPGRGLRPMKAMLVRASQDIGALASQFVRQKKFASSGLTGRLMKRLASEDAQNESDLLSYLLFEGGFAKELIDLGREDARARHDELCAFFDALQ